MTAFIVTTVVLVLSVSGVQFLLGLIMGLMGKKYEGLDFNALANQIRKSKESEKVGGMVKDFCKKDSEKAGHELIQDIEVVATSMAWGAVGHTLVTPYRCTRQWMMKFRPQVLSFWRELGLAEAS